MKTTDRTSGWVFSSCYLHLRVFVSRTFNVQNLRHIGRNITDQLTEP